MFSPKFTAFAISLLAINNVLSFTPYTPSLFYAGYAAFVVFLALTHSKHHLNFSVVAFVFVCFLSILENNIPELFKPYERYFLFLIMLLIISPLLKGAYIFEVKRLCFKYSNYFIVAITLLSFLGKYGGVYSGLDYAANFGGLTINSMTLSPLAGISLLIGVYVLTARQLTRKQKYALIALTSISFLILILSASRIAIAGCFMATIFYLSRLYKKRFGKFLKIILVFSTVLFVSYPLWQGYTENLIQKTQRQEAIDKQFGSREDLWSYRLDEFKESPFLGIGFAYSKYGTINYETGTIEPGTSWGAILAMTGIVGLVSFVIIIWRSFSLNYSAYGGQVPIISHFLNALLLFFAIHWIAEGYMLAAGSYLFFYAWLVIGLCDINKHKIKIEVL